MAERKGRESLTSCSHSTLQNKVETGFTDHIFKGAEAAGALPYPQLVEHLCLTRTPLCRPHIYHILVFNCSFQEAKD